MRGSPRPTLRRRGVTIIELLIVLAIIGILVGFALPKIDIAKYKINSGMRIVGTALLSAQRRAVSAQHDVIVTFDVANNVIRIHEDANNNGSVDSGERTRAVAKGESVLLGQGTAPAHAVGAGPVAVTKTVGGLPALVFHRNGSASEFAGVYLTSPRAIRSSTFASDTRLLLIERSTGRVSWFRYTTQWIRGF